MIDKLALGLGVLTSSPKKIKASTGYAGASSGRRMGGWNAPMLGPNTINLSDWLQLIRRSRDASRNSPLAASAIQKFTSNVIGTGIVPHFKHPDPNVRKTIQTAWDAWVKQADFADQYSFYGVQMLVARGLFEAGEIFCRYRMPDENQYFQLQLVESEQVPIYITMQDGWNPNTTIKEGIIFSKTTDKRVGYRIYKSQPYDSIVNPVLATQFANLTTEEMIQVILPVRAGSLRGVPMIAPVLQLLWDIEGYADSERLRKRLSAMFAFFIEQNLNEDEMMPIYDGPEESTNPDVATTPLEPGTMQRLNPGEKLSAPNIPESPGYADFMYHEIHKLAAGVGLTYEMLTMDMKGVNYSSARVSRLEVYRFFSQLQKHVLEHQFCDPVMRRWMREAVLSGHLELPIDYIDNPEVYEMCDWVPDGWEYVDPVNEVKAAESAIRDGLTSRSATIRARGGDPESVDAEIAFERKREKQLGIITDTNANEVLIGRETQPLTITTPDPNQQTDETADEDSEEESDEE